MQVQRAIRVPAVLASAFALTACGDIAGTGADCPAAIITIDAVRGVNDPVQLVGGEPVYLTAIVMDAGMKPVGRRDIAWSGPGSFDHSTTITDDGGFTSVQWTPPDAAGEHHVNATCGNVTGTMLFQTTSSYATRVELAAPSVAITRFASYPVSVALYDKAGNPDASTAHLELVTTGPFVALWGYQSKELRVVPQPGLVHGSGSVTVRVAAAYDPATPVLATLSVNLDVAPKTVTIRGAPDGLAVGETVPLSATATDSSNNTVTLSATALGDAPFVSSDPGVAEITNGTALTGKAVGFATITLNLDGRAWTSDVVVAPSYDIGSITSLLYLAHPELYTSQAALIDTTGRVILETQFMPHAGVSNGGTLMDMYGADGSKLWSRSYTDAPASSNFAPDGGAYIVESSKLLATRLSSSGSVMWNVASIRGAPSSDPTALFIAGANSVMALDAVDGKALWQSAASPFNNTIDRIVVSPARVFIQRTNDVSAIDRQGNGGNEVWSRAGRRTSASVADAASTFYGYQSNGSLEAIDATGATLWTMSLGGSSAHLAVAPNNALIVASDATLRSIDRTTGEIRWTVHAPFTMSAIAAVTDRITVVGGQHFFFFDAGTGQLLGRSMPALPSSITQAKCTAAGLMFVSNYTVYRYDRCS